VDEILVTHAAEIVHQHEVSRVADEILVLHAAEIVHRLDLVGENHAKPGSEDALVERECAEAIRYPLHLVFHSPVAFHAPSEHLPVGLALHPPGHQAVEALTVVDDFPLLPHLQ
jgi:hypothetical protein